MRQLSLRVDEELYRRMEEARGPIPRERWLRAVIQAHLNGIRFGASPDEPPAVPSPR